MGHNIVDEADRKVEAIVKDLHRCKLFADNLSSQIMRQLAGACSYTKGFCDKEVILTKGMPSDEMFIVRGKNSNKSLSLLISLVPLLTSQITSGRVVISIDGE